MHSPNAKSRLHVFERNLELELEPLKLRDTIGLTVIFASLCVESCGGVLLLAVWLHVHGQTAYTGLWLAIGGATVFGLTVWWLQPHKAAKHAAHRFRHHARKLRRSRNGHAQHMTDAEFNALEDAVDRSDSHSPS